MRAVVHNLHAIVTEYVDGYEMEADDGNYTPNDDERALISDAIHGLIADDDFKEAIVQLMAQNNRHRGAGNIEVGSAVFPQPITAQQVITGEFSSNYRDGWNACTREAVDCAVLMSDTAIEFIKDVDKREEEVKKLAHEIDALLVGEANAAKAPALIDIIGSLEHPKILEQIITHLKDRRAKMGD